MVSVIVACRNAEPWIAEAVRSALQEGCAEILLVDDGSSDRSNEIALEAGCGKLRVLPGERRGVSAARNVGMIAATQPWIQFLDADDVLGDGKIARQLTFGEHTGADVVYGDFRELCEVAVGQYEPGEWRRVDLTGDTSSRVFSWPQWIQIGAMLFRRSALNRVGGHDAAMTHIEEVNLYLRLALDGARFMHDGASGEAVWHRKHRSVVSLGASNRAGFHAGCLHNVELARNAWQSTPEGLTFERRRVLLDDYEFLARFYYVHDRPTFQRVMKSIRSLAPDFVPSAPPMLRRLSQLIGYEQAEAIALRYRDAKQRWQSILGRKADQGFWNKPAMPSYAKATAGKRDQVGGDA
jgi:glycosyltransferase involved in cell wall biosynthesis